MTTRGAAAIVSAIVAISGGAAFADNEKASAPIPAETVALMAAKNTSPSAPVLIRTYKKEAELEVWKLARNGRYVHIKTFPICRWSGQLGPKQTQGDRQAPEGFYPIARRQMNPNSHYYLSFDTGFPNAYDKAHGATGAYLMVHGTCSSAGCYAMTDKQIGEIYAIAREAFAGGQQAFQFQAFPFRMTAQNMARYRTDKNIDFWRQLKEGSDRFEATGEEPVVNVVDGRYTFAPSRNPEREKAAQTFHTAEEEKIASLSEGSAALRITYSDGGQHPAFAALLKQGENLGDVSRPEALTFAGQEIVVIPARKKKNVLIAALSAAPIAVAPEPAGRDICIALPVRAITADDLLFSTRSLGCGNTRAGVASIMTAGRARILPPTLGAPALEVVVANR
ncbi:MAG: murein L,D-transpeptidase [Methylobacteriaceae bacterium]|nr:murein L,D-transpeptidase [Methylobacteriaceae bacterium]